MSIHRNFVVNFVLFYLDQPVYDRHLLNNNKYISYNGEIPTANSDFLIFDHDDSTR